MGLFSNKSKAVSVSAPVVTATQASIDLLFNVELVPQVSEKSSRLNSIGQYIFKVRPGISKTLVKKAIESRFGVKVVSVNSVKLPRKKIRRGRTIGQQKLRQHMIVSLAKGQNLDIAKV